MMTRVLMINRQLVFAVTIKQALEQTGSFDVHPFTTLDTALEYLREHPQDIALVDFSLPSATGLEITARLREIQPELPIIASPQQAENVIKSLDLQGNINAPFTARDIIPLIERVAKKSADRKTATPPETPKVKPSKTKPLPPDDDLPGTRKLAQTEKQTRILNDTPEELGTKKLPDLPPNLPEKPSTPAPAKLPEFSSLEDVLSGMKGTNLFDEPEIQDSDTPPVPLERSEALRNFATTSRPEDVGFDNVLHEIDSQADYQLEEQDSDAFDELVNSMRGEVPYRPLPDRQQQFVEFIVRGGMDSLLTEIGKSKTEPLADQEAKPPKSKPVSDESSVFQKLAADEPPLPTFEESGTVRDLMLGVSDTGFQNVLKLMRGEEVEENQFRPASQQELEEAFASFYQQQALEEQDFIEEESVSFASSIVNLPSEDFSFDADDEEQEDGEATPAQFILETALDETTPPESFSIDDLLGKIEEQLASYKPDIQPLPSWGSLGRGDDRYVREPSFLPELPRLDEDAVLFDDTTQPSKAQQENIEAAPQQIETELLELLSQSQVAQPETAEPAPADELPEFDEPAQEVWSENISQEIDHLFTAPEDEWPGEDTRPLPAIEQAAVESPDEVEFYPAEAMDEGIITQLAVNLTQASLESTAEATLLTREGEIVAYAGHLAREDVEELRGFIPTEQGIGLEDARIRFVTLEASRKDYMLFSCRTDGEYILSMVFAESTPIRTIRRQGKRLAEALQSVPDNVIDEAIEAVEAAPVQEVVQQTPVIAITGPLMNYSFLWMLRDPVGQLSDSAREAITTGLRAQLNSQGWQVDHLEANEDFIYILAGVPGETPTYEVVRDLKRRSSALASSRDRSIEPESLWSESYLVMSPGRELDIEEIQQFINFERLL
jgi:DNA-binding NarL/FixJ family response regulator/REP element-mobilizing transposase RayT